MTAFAKLRNMIPDPHPVERCDVCHAAIPQRHGHLMEVATRRLICTCDACGIVFPSSAGAQYKAVPSAVRFLRDFQFSVGQWDSLLIPIGLAFFYRNSTYGRVMAFYPSPAGPVESLLPLNAWEELAADCPALPALQCDVEALLVNRLEPPGECFIAPIDKCYELAGLVRANWSGLSGGSEMWDKVRAFFEGLREDARA